MNTNRKEIIKIVIEALCENEMQDNAGYNDIAEAVANKLSEKQLKQSLSTGIYITYGEEWKRQLSFHTKSEIIEMFATTASKDKLRIQELEEDRKLILSGNNPNKLLDE